MIRIIAKHTNGFWRCGLFHRPEPVEYTDDHFSAAELAILTAEPMLRVEFIVEPVEYAEPLRMEEPSDLMLNIEEVEKPVKVEPPKRGRPRKY